MLLGSFIIYVSAYFFEGSGGARDNVHGDRVAVVPKTARVMIGNQPNLSV